MQTPRGAREPERGDQPERGGEHAEHRAERVAGVEPRDRSGVPLVVRWTCRCAVRRSIAGSVAPIAAVAGSSSRNVPQNATDHCQTGAGCAPVNRSTQRAERRHREDQQQAPERDDELAAGVPAHRPRAALDARARARARRPRARRRTPPPPPAPRRTRAPATARTAASRRSGSRARQSPTPPSTPATPSGRRTPPARLNAEPDDVAPGIQLRRDGVERERDAPLALVGRHRVHQVAREQHQVAGLRAPG